MSARSDQQAASSPLLHATADITAPAAIVLVAITGTVDAAVTAITTTLCCYYTLYSTLLKRYCLLRALLSST
eukprot:21420-Heterococcus_DN1.PRE.1